MIRQQTTLRRFYPVLPVLFTMLISYYAYFGSRHLDNDSLHLIIAAVFGTTYFLSITLGTLYIFTRMQIQGTSIAPCFLASMIVPFTWMSKEVYVLTESHPLLEALYWYVNPLNLWLLFATLIQAGVAVILARAILNKRGGNLKVVTAGPVIVSLTSLVLSIAAYSWGEGENSYVLFLALYRDLFGTGI